MVVPILAALCVPLGCAQSKFPAHPPEQTVFSGATMGTTYMVRLASATEGPSANQLHIRISDRLSEIDQKMSTYVPQSEVSRFNQHAGREWFSVTNETAVVVAAAQKIADDTGGAFDITVGPLVDLWSFGPQRRPGHLPNEQEIASAKSRVGYKHIEVRLDPPGLRKQQADVAIDLSGIAKGFAVDQIAELLDQQAVEGYMIEIGGEIRTKGRKLDGKAWRIGIERPVSHTRAIHCVVALEDQALASSGDYRNFFEWKGRHYSHEIDPLTGAPVGDQLASISVLADNAMTADAMATALFVMGPEKAWDFAQEHQLDVLFILREGDHFRDKMTAGFSTAIIRYTPL